MSIQYTIEVRSERTLRLLDEIEDQFPRIERMILKRISERVVSITQKDKLRGQVLKRQSGDLAGSIHYVLKGDDTSIVGTNMVYAAIHEFGGKIKHPGGTPYYYDDEVGRAIFMKKDGNYPDSVKFTAPHTIPIPARPYLGPTIATFFQDGSAKRLAELTLKEEFERIQRSV